MRSAHNVGFFSVQFPHTVDTYIQCNNARFECVEAFTGEHTNDGMIPRRIRLVLCVCSSLMLLHLVRLLLLLLVMMTMMMMVFIVVP